MRKLVETGGTFEHPGHMTDTETRVPFVFNTGLGVQHRGLVVGAAWVQRGQVLLGYWARWRWAKSVHRAPVRPFR